jgi:hypothetical protein
VFSPPSGGLKGLYGHLSGFSSGTKINIRQYTIP